MLTNAKPNCIFKEWSQVRLQDIADVQDSQKLQKKIARVDQKSSIILQIINNLTPML
jgi:multidrug efflux pump subunit AcrB